MPRAPNHELIARFEKKIQATLTRVWGKEAPVSDPSKKFSEQRKING